MKIRLLIIIAICSFTAKSFAQKEVNGCIVTLKGQASIDLTFNSDTISVSFIPTEYAWGVKTTNKLKEDVSVIWDKSSFILNGAASKVIFDNTLKMNKDNAIPDQEIPAGSFIDKKIFPSGSFNERWASPTISKREVKNRFKVTGKPDIVKIILALQINGAIKKYDFNFEIVPKFNHAN